MGEAETKIGICVVLPGACKFTVSNTILIVNKVLDRVSFLWAFLNTDGIVLVIWETKFKTNFCDS